MIWSSASAFFEMGGYGLYVWGSYGVAALLMFVEPWLVHRRLNRSLRDAARIESGNEVES
jgi:heme exporter protein D